MPAESLCRFIQMQCMCRIYMYGLQSSILMIVVYMYLYNRISGGLASNKNIHGTVSEQIQKNWAKLKWKVRIILSLVFA